MKKMISFYKETHYFTNQIVAHTGLKYSFNNTNDIYLLIIHISKENMNN